MLIGIIGSILDAFFAVLLVIARFFPLMIRSYYELWKSYLDANCNWKIACFISFILGNIIIPGITVLCKINIFFF